MSEHVGSPLRLERESLEEYGYTILPNAVPSPDIDEFHAVMREAGAALCERHRVPRRHEEPMLDLLLRGGAYRTQLFSLLKNLFVVQRMSTELVQRLRAGGLWEQLSMRAPLAWPTLRADPPNESTYLLPMHQDYGSTRCHVALRAWVPLTAADSRHGTMRVVEGSHKLGYLEHDTSDPSYPAVPAARYRQLPTRELECEPGAMVLFFPTLIHGSVPNRGTTLKYVLLLQIQELATMADPSDPSEPMRTWLESAETRRRAE